MMAQIKAALLGDVHRTGGSILPSHDAPDTDGTRAEPAVSEIDPFRPASFPADRDNPDHIETDQIFDILGNQRRRNVLKYLSMTEGTVTLSDLAEWIAAGEYDKDVEQLTTEERKRVYVSLYQIHLPKMADLSVISYDQRSGEIETGELFGPFKDYLRQNE